MVLIGADNHRGALPRGHGLPNAEQVHQTVQPRGRARAGKDYRMIRPRAGQGRNPRPRLAPKRRNARATIRSFGVAVGIDRQDLVQHRHFQGRQRPARGDVIGIKHWLWAKRTLDHQIAADDLVMQRSTDVARAKAGAERRQEREQVRHARLSSGLSSRRV
jgi:hypothetical protein